MGKIQSHLNVYHFITAIINGNDLKQSLTLICEFKFIIYLPFLLLLTLVRNAMMISAWLCPMETPALPSCVCTHALIQRASAHTFLFTFFVAWRCKAFADFQGSLSVYPLSKSIAAPRLKQSAKRTKQSMMMRTMMIISAEEILLELECLPFCQEVGSKMGPTTCSASGSTPGQSTVK